MNMSIREASDGPNECRPPMWRGDPAVLAMTLIFPQLIIDLSCAAIPLTAVGDSSFWETLPTALQRSRKRKSLKLHLLIQNKLIQ
jgi:hypothetical protein